MLEQLGVFSKKFLFPLAIIAFGAILVTIGVKPDEVTDIKQTSRFLYGGVAILGMGVITLLYMLDIINRMVHFILSVLLLVITVVLAVTTFDSVKETVDLRDQKVETDLLVKQGLSDLRDIQLSYKKKYGVYAKSFSELTQYIKHDSLPYIQDVWSQGYSEVPDGRITNPEHIALLGYDVIRDEKKLNDYDEEECIKIGILDKDTSYYPVMEELFTGPDAINKERAFVFDADQMKYVPMSDNVEFSMKVDTLDNGNWVFEIRDPAPFDPFNSKDTLIVGSMKESKTSGNWNE